MVLLLEYIIELVARFSSKQPVVQLCYNPSSHKRKRANFNTAMDESAGKNEATYIYLYILRIFIQRFVFLYTHTHTLNNMPLQTSVHVKNIQFLKKIKPVCVTVVLGLCC